MLNQNLKQMEFISKTMMAKPSTTVPTMTAYHDGKTINHSALAYHDGKYENNKL